MTPMRAVPFVLLLGLAAISCAPRDGRVLSVTSDLPSGVHSRDGVIEFAFSRGVAPAESLNVWTIAPLVEFTPAIPGKFVWQDSTRLVFSPDAPLAGDVKYTGTLNTSLLTSMARASSFRGSAEFSFSTERFTLASAELYYDRIGESRQVGIKANLEFTYMVNPQDLPAHITVTLDKNPQQIARVLSTEKSKTIALEIGSTLQLDRQRELSISFDGDLISPETNTRLRMERPFLATLPSLAEVQILGHAVTFDGTTSAIRVTTSQEFSEAAVRSHVTLDPVRPFTVQNNGSGFTITGAFEPGTAFRIVIGKGMESLLGGKTQNDYQADIVVGNIAPSFRFASPSGLYMLMGGRRTLEFKTTNMPRVLLRVSQVFQNNLVFFLDNGRFYDYSYDDEGDGEGGYNSSRAKYRYYLGNFGRQLKVDTLRIAEAPNQELTSTIDLNPYLRTGYKGFILVEIADPKQQWRSTSKLISMSDLGLIVKRSSDEVMVFATNLLTARPVPGALVTLISTTNQVIAATKTGSDGAARFPGFRATTKEFVLKLVTAETDNDFNFINLADYRVENSRFDVGGKRDADAVYDAFLYGDRTLYRPGETITVAGVVRCLGDALPAGMPVRVKISNARGNVVAEMQMSLNQDGAFETTYQTGSTAPTGEYRADLFTGAGSFLGTYKMSVEDFVPDRLRLTLSASRETARPGEEIRYDLTALNFFGPPAAGRRWEFEGSFDVLPYLSKVYPEFRFYDDAAKPYAANPEVMTGTTDDEGKAVVRFAVPGSVTSTGVLRGRGRVAVFDESGRPVYQIAQTTVYPKPYFVGVRNHGAHYVSPGTPQRLEIVAVDPSDKPINGFKAKVELIRREWHSVLRQHEGTRALRYVSELREIVEKTERITLGDAPYAYVYIAPRSGDFLVRVSRDGETGYNQFGFYSYSWGTSDVTSFEIDPEARVDIVFDKPQYAPGEKARVLFQTPFSGTMLVTVERNKVLSSTYLDVVNNAASLELTVDEKFMPNVYIAAVLFRKIKDEDIPLMAGHGFAPLPVERKSNRLAVAIKAPEKVRPRGKHTVTVTTGEKNVSITLAAVDEGICQVKNYKTPDPYGYFYAKKTLETETFDFFKHLIPEPRGAKGRSVTGGSDADVAQRANPLGVQRFKPLALWSGILKTNGNGEAEVTLELPEFNGELRLMAIAFKGDRFGSAQRAMKVSDPVVITPALPRFLSPGDSIVMPLTAFNTTGKPISLSFEVDAAGPLVPVARTAGLELGPNQERFVNVMLRASRQIGKATVTVRTSAPGEILESRTELPVRPAAPFTTEGFSGFVDGGTSVSHDVPDAYLPFGRKSYVTLSPFPVANFAQELKHLVGYPHGCLEQTVSRAFPQIYLRDIAAVLAPSILANGSTVYYVNEAITKITSMQLYDGSFATWPGEAVSNPWSTVYATHFLLEARKAGFAVPEAALKGALAALSSIARSRTTEDYRWTLDGRVVVRRIANKSTVYALYVLALGRTPEKAVMDFYRSEKNLLTHDTRFLLAGAYALSGSRSVFQELLPAEFVSEEAVRTSGDNFDSPIRANALMLNILLDTDLNNPNIPRYMEYLSARYRAHPWYSTQDDAFTLLAFGKAARMASATSVEGVVHVGGKEYPYKGGNQRLDIEPYGKKVALTMRGDGRVYYSLVTEGIRSDGAVKIEDKNLQVRRELLDRSGNAVNTAAIRQNDLLVVRVTLTASVDRLDNIAISDLLPGGFELENPRITEATNYAFIKNPTIPQYMDIRDDRINIYTGIRDGNRRQQFYYAVRAVTQGSFQYAPITATAMYDAEYVSASGGGKLRIGK